MCVGGGGGEMSGNIFDLNDLNKPIQRNCMIEDVPEGLGFVEIH